MTSTISSQATGFIIPRNDREAQGRHFSFSIGMQTCESVKFLSTRPLIFVYFSDIENNLRSLRLLVLVFSLNILMLT